MGEVKEERNYQVPEYEGYMAFLNFVSWDWNVTNEDACANGVDAVVTGNGTYTVSLDLEEGQEVNAVRMLCVDIKGLADAQNLDVSDIGIHDVIVKCDNQVVDSDMSKMYFGCIEGKGDIRLEIYNAYGYFNLDNENNFTTADEVDPEQFAFGKEISVTFTLTGMKKGATATDGNYTIKTGTGDVAGEVKRKSLKTPTPEATNTPEATSTVETPAPGAENTPEATSPTGTSTPGNADLPTATPPVGTRSPEVTNSAENKIVTPSVKGTDKITVKKKTVVVAPGKKTTIKYTIKREADTSGAASVKAFSANKKIAKVSLNTKKKILTIKVPQKATSGLSTTVRVIYICYIFRDKGMVSFFIINVQKMRNLRISLTPIYVHTKI